MSTDSFRPSPPSSSASTAAGELYAAVLAHSVVGICILDLEDGGRVLDGNAAVHELFGYARGELNGRAVLDLSVADDRERHRELLLAVARGEQPSFQIELRCLRRDGQGLWVRLSVSAVPEGEAEACRFALGIVEDLTERKERERELAEASALHRALLQSAVDAIITIDELGLIESFNPAAEGLFGYRAEEVIGRNVSMLMPQPYRDEHEGYLHAYRTTGVRKIIGIGRLVTARRKDGEVFPIDLAVSEAVVGDRRIFMGTVRDISARRAAEDEIRRQRDFLEQLLEIAPAIILVVDSEGHVVRYSQYLERLVGRPLGELMGLDAIEALVPEARRAAARDRLAGWLAGDAARDVELPLRNAAGAELQVVWNAARLKDAAGALSALLVIGLDVTEHRRLQEELQHSQRMEALGLLAGGVAHDFNTLLGSILGYSELLIERGVDDSLRRAAYEIRASAERGAALSRRLLAFGKRRPMAVERLDLNVLLGGMAAMLERLIGANIKLELVPAPHEVPVVADPGLLEQVVVNLVLNAVDAITGSGRISVTVRLDDPDGVVLLVRDTGCGMSEEVQRRIFDPFFTTKPGKGSGLGLSTVYGIVEQSGGAIRVDSRPGAGSTFSVFLPRAAQPPPESERVEAERSSTGRGEVVLVVEDDEIFRGLISEVLGRAGYQVLAAATPSEAIAAASQGDPEPQLVLCDLGLPEMDGLELTRRLRERLPGLRVLLMSGYGDRTMPEEDSPNEPFLAKPFRNQELLRRLREVLDG
ncbi:MAG TPA: PAS domain S-box protein [Thermoanaerobaculia bacterium]|nr:PAS domain S-box protein [Thermoanaerobaculia bacterium]